MQGVMGQWRRGMPSPTFFQGGAASNCFAKTRWNITCNNRYITCSNNSMIKSVSYSQASCYPLYPVTGLSCSSPAILSVIFQVLRFQSPLMCIEYPNPNPSRDKCYRIKTNRCWKVYEAVGNDVNPASMQEALKDWDLPAILVVTKQTRDRHLRILDKIAGVIETKDKGTSTLHFQHLMVMWNVHSAVITIWQLLFKQTVLV